MDPGVSESLGANLELLVRQALLRLLERIAAQIVQELHGDSPGPSAGEARDETGSGVNW